MKLLLFSTHHVPQLFGVAIKSKLLGRFAEQEGSRLEVGELQEIAEQVHLGCHYFIIKIYMEKSITGCFIQMSERSCKWLVDVRLDL